MVHMKTDASKEKPSGIDDKPKKAKKTKTIYDAGLHVCLLRSSAVAKSRRKEK